MARLTACALAPSSPSWLAPKMCMLLKCSSVS
eukprot:CAMPEP_0169468222 /NCGR_PEP_ID=MMETSP1042-20121227/22784_1 /TAXON_ID=464988 /ORGANISM="Hemiselmis andersenii, Strain CCMP1180" /LENGTH=31 /DNA_ID= /DNA_START= /DNA_END= /DNA_ORIENTATION=